MRKVDYDVYMMTRHLLNVFADETSTSSTPTKMELEELMTNRSLLEKMSEEDNIHTANGYRKNPKQVIIQDNRQIPNNKKGKDLRIEYKNNSNGHVVQSTVQVQGQQNDAVVLDGYGCQCPPKFVKTLKVFWTLFLVLYVLGMPVVLYHLYSRLSLTKTRLQRLEREFDDHILLTATGSFRSSASSGQEYDDGSSSNKVNRKTPISSSVDSLRRHYTEFSQFQTRTEQEMKKLEATLQKYEKRMVFVSVLERSFNSSQNTTGNCSCNRLKALIGSRNTSCPPCKNQLVSSPKSVYTRWGKSSCMDNENVTTIYHGYIGSSYHTHQGGGSNYMCLPSKPSYHKADSHSNFENRGYIHGVEFELGDSNLFDTKVTGGQYYDALCSVCERKHKYNSLMIPGTTYCPVGWNREYYGYLMAQKKFLKRTEFICVDHKPDLTIGTEDWGKGAFLHFVETRCGVLPCRKGMYQDLLEMTCVVCSR